VKLGQIVCCDVHVQRFVSSVPSTWNEVKEYNYNVTRPVNRIHRTTFTGCRMVVRSGTTRPPVSSWPRRSRPSTCWVFWR